MADWPSNDRNNVVSYIEAKADGAVVTQKLTALDFLGAMLAVVDMGGGVSSVKVQVPELTSDPDTPLPNTMWVVREVDAVSVSHPLPSLGLTARSTTYIYYLRFRTSLGQTISMRFA